ncbi:fimbrial chaperone [Photobacterium leiognathi]|uniref:Chaperone n=2 Tax=Photobacterium leiognathi TaxID=553611 RepID=O68439_PHOLE|nr:fimbrial chaperone [Photobacterium leiognathi]AAC38328.1 chaperone precursor [Photobacterium leiognathi]KJF85395.1 fimbrial chaperone protein [Photobacterium leiognathi]
MKKTIFALLFMSVFISYPSFAAFILNGTRYIYNENDKNISITISNESKETYGGQVWVDNINESDNSVSFIAIPSFFKVDGNDNQIIRIMKTSEALPKDRESIFWLNVQEIPPKSKDKKSNIIVVAINTKVKLIYRPDNLSIKRLNAEKRIKLINDNGNYYLENPTPYYFAITKIIVNEKTISLKNKVSNKLAIFAPKTKVKLTSINLNSKSKIKIDAIDDYGATNQYEIN